MVQEVAAFARFAASKRIGDLQGLKALALGQFAARVTQVQPYHRPGRTNLLQTVFSDDPRNEENLAAGGPRQRNGLPL